MNRKADITFMTVIILVLIVSSGVMVFFVVETNDIISSSKDDILCNSFLKLKGNNIYNIVDFFNQLNVKCSVDEITIDTSKSQEIYKKFADTSTSCYDRYGKGEYDFLENYKAEGNWCFLCAKVSFDNSVEHKSDYFDFIKWTQINTIPTNKSQSYYDYTNYIYINPDNDEMQDLENDISTLISEVSSGEVSELLDVSLLTLEKYQLLVDYQLKSFDSSQDYYITYKFDRLPNINSRLEQAGTEATGAIIGGLAASIGTEAVLGLFTFGIGTIKSIVTAPLKIARFAKIKSIIDRINDFKIFSKLKKVNSYLDDTVTIVSSSGKTVRLSKKIQSFRATPDDLIGFSELLKNDVKFGELSKKFGELANVMNKNNIKHFDDLDSLKLDKELIENLKYFAKADIPVGEGINGLKLSSQIKEMQQIASEDLLKLSTQSSTSMIPSVKNLIRISAFSTGAYLGLVYTDENPSNQYIDIMTKEEFYRQCGFPAGVTATN